MSMDADLVLPFYQESYASEFPLRLDMQRRSSDVGSKLLMLDVSRWTPGLRHR